MEFSGTDIATIRLFYETYGYTPAEIAQSTGHSASVISMAIGEYGLVQDREQVVEDLQKSVQEKELHKQLVLMPHYARAEALILGKIIHGVEQINQCDEMFRPQATAMYAKAMKDLRSVSQTLSVGDSDSTGITVQILNQIS